jgi:hypothetical protein
MVSSTAAISYDNTRKIAYLVERIEVVRGVLNKILHDFELQMETFPCGRVRKRFLYFESPVSPALDLQVENEQAENTTREDLPAL